MLFSQPFLRLITSSILEAPGRKTVCLVVVVPVQILIIVVEVPVPRVGCIVLRRRPEVGVVRKIVEIAIVVPVAARKSNRINSHLTLHFFIFQINELFTPANHFRGGLLD